MAKRLIIALAIVLGSFNAFSQLNRTINDEGKDILYGFCTRDVIENNGDGWFKSEYEAYIVKTKKFNLVH